MSAKSELTKPDIRLSCNVLKIIACVFMFIDHFSYGVLHNYMIAHAMDLQPETYKTLNTVYEVGRGVGRLAFPIFCFFLVEGFLRTHDVKKYAIRLLVLSVITEVPFDLGLFGEIVHNDHQNIIITFFIALMMLVLLRFISGNILGVSTWVVYLSYICTVIAFADVAYLLNSDYSWKCMLLVAVLYFTREAGVFRLLAGACATCWEKYAPISFLLLYFYDPEKPPKFKYAFYLFYPIHLLVIYMIAKLVI